MSAAPSKWRKAVEDVCMHMNLDKTEVLVNASREINELKSMAVGAWWGSHITVGDVYARSFYHLFVEVKQQLKRHCQLSQLTQELFPPDLWKIVADFDSLNKAKLSMLMPLLKRICEDRDMWNGGQDNSYVMIWCQNIYAELLKTF